MKNLFILVSLFVITGCTSNQSKQVGCDVEKTLVGITSNGIATSLQCTNKDAIVSSLEQATGKLNFCKPPSAAFKANPLSSFCAPVVNILVTSVIDGTIPSAWGCSAKVASANLSQLLINACSGQPAAIVSPAVRL